MFAAASALALNCQSPANQQEKLVCSDAQLTSLVAEYEKIYPRVYAAENKAALEIQQTMWIDNRDPCSSVECLKDAYQERLGQLRRMKLADPAPAAAPSSSGLVRTKSVDCTRRNRLVCLAIYAAASAKETIGKIAALWIPTTVFVAIGFEHCIANMFFIPAATFVAADPRYAALVEADKAPAAAFSWQDVVVGNLLPVTAGNIAGALVFVAGFYCVIHWRELHALSRRQGDA